MRHATGDVATVVTHIAFVEVLPRETTAAVSTWWSHQTFSTSVYPLP